MKRTTRLIVGGSMAAAGLAAAAGVAAAATGGGGDDAGETPITGSALDKASAAALEHTGQGRVTESETGDEASYYEVEVALDNGNEVDVQLDRSFNVVGEDNDAGENDVGDDDEPGDDNEGDG